MKNFSILSKLAFCFLFLMGSSSLFAQWNEDDKNRIEKDLNLSDFTKVSVGYGIDIHLHQSANFKVTMKATEKDMERVEVQVKGNTLVIKAENWKKRIGRVDVIIYAPTLDKISASGGSDVYGKGSWTFDDIEFNLSGGSDVDMKLKANDITCHASGGSDLELSGEARGLYVNCSGGSDVDAQGLKVKVCEANASGGSDIDVYVTESINASASGASDISYRGNPTKVKQSSSSGSDISN